MNKREEKYMNKERRAGFIKSSVQYVEHYYFEPLIYFVLLKLLILLFSSSQFLFLAGSVFLCLCLPRNWMAFTVLDCSVCVVIEM